jgi:hypothetical protein
MSWIHGITLKLYEWRYEMTKRFCSQCGTEVPAGSSFCPACGAAQRTAAQQPYQNNAQPNPNQQPYQTPPQPNRQPYQAAPQIDYGAPRVTGAKATGLIIGVFTLVAAFLLIVLVFVLPSKEDFSLLSAAEGPQTSVPSAAQPGFDTALPAATHKYGAPPLRF